MLVRLGFATGRWTTFPAPVVGLLVFWLLPFKPAMGLYALTVGLTMMLQPVVEEARMRWEIEDIARRRAHEYYAR